MRIDAREMSQHSAAMYRVWDCDQCRARDDVVWVDDERHEYGTQHKPFIGNRFTITHHARIAILPDERLVFINPKLSRDELQIEMTELVAEMLGAFPGKGDAA